MVPGHKLSSVEEVDVLAPQDVEDVLEQVVDVPVAQVAEEVVQVAKVVPQERAQQRTVERAPKR